MASAISVNVHSGNANLCRSSTVRSNAAGPGRPSMMVGRTGGLASRCALICWMTVTLNPTVNRATATIAMMTWIICQKLLSEGNNCATSV